GAQLGNAVGTATVNDNDVAPELSVDSVSGAEGSGSLTFTVSVTPASALPLTVAVVTADDSATAGSDYTALSTTLNIPANATAETFQVALLDDSDTESDETFTVTLSNPTGGATLGTASGTGTIENDDAALACGQPSYNPATDKGVYVSKLCSNGRWRIESVGGGSYTNFIGDITSVQALTNLQLISIEGTDDINTNGDPNVIDYSMKVSGSGVDAIVFAATAGASNCFTLSSPTNEGVFLGPDKTPMPLSFDLDTLGPCGAGGHSFVSISDAQADEGAGTMNFQLTVSPSSTDAISVDVTSTNGSAQAGSDFDAVSTTVNFASGQTTATLAVPITDDTATEGAESFQLTLSNPVNAALGTATATGTITDNDGISCGAPSFNPASDRGLYVWQSCSNGRWNVQAAAGGIYTQYSGFLNSPQNFSNVRGIGLEGSDTLNNSNRRVINYVLKVAGSGLDAFEFGFNEPAGACFTLNAPGNVTVFHGPDKQVRGNSFDVATGGPCN
ncbi:MAG: Calx-beta domain-containing protein, partial [Pseudomonadota bacterium]